MTTFENGILKYKVTKCTERACQMTTPTVSIEWAMPYAYRFDDGVGNFLGGYAYNIHFKDEHPEKDYILRISDLHWADDEEGILRVTKYDLANDKVIYKTYRLADEKESEMNPELRKALVELY
jgi:hypothetical protein